MSDPSTRAQCEPQGLSSQVSGHLTRHERNTNMKIAVIHDYANVFRGTRAYPRLQEHEVIIHADAYTDPARVVAQVAGCDALLLTQQRVPMPRQIIERLPDLKCISQTGRNTNH